MATLFTTEAAQPREREPARVPTFPRPTSIDVKFHTWRMVTWEVVRVDNSWKRARGSSEHYPATLGFVVRGEQPLTADEIAWWQGYDGGLVGLQEAA